MRTRNLTYLIDWEEDIVFKSEYAHLEERDGAFYCSLRGEFFKKDQPYYPPMIYEMRYVSVPKQRIEDILYDKYIFLLQRDYPDEVRQLLRKK